MCKQPYPASAIGQAVEVWEETGLTPRQLAEQNKELVAALEEWVFAWKAWEVTGIPKTPEESELIFNNACAAHARAKGAK